MRLNRYREMVAVFGETACQPTGAGNFHTRRNGLASLALRAYYVRLSRLASASSFSKKLYYIECEGEEKVPSGDWLTQKLDEYRVARAIRG